MDQDFDFHVRVEWKTISHYPSTTLTCPTFSLMGLEWYLEFRKDSFIDGLLFHSRYIVNLIPKKTEGEEGAALQTPFEVETYLLVPTEDFTKKRCKITRRDEVEIFDSGYFEDYRKPRTKLDEVKIVCQIYDVECYRAGTKAKPETTQAADKLADGPSDLECLSRDLGRLLEGEQLPDVHLNCCGETFPAHRSVLAARSEVFAAMFRNKMSESQTGGVDVNDFDPDVVRQFLRYLYSGEMSAESGEAAASLFAIGDKYAVDSLKRACTRCIVGGLTQGNCIEYLTVADLHGSGPLKQEIVAFICGHPAVMLGEGWEGFSEKNPKLALEVHQSFVRSKTEIPDRQNL